MRHVVEVSQFDREGLEQLFARADECGRSSGRRPVRPGDPRHDLLRAVDPDPAQLRVGHAPARRHGDLDGERPEFSSAIKGETVEDTVMMASGYADAIVIRHHEQGAAARAAAVSTVPIINAGDGPGEHPTQALLDLYTIRHELGRIDDLTIALMGDLRYGRTARSLALLTRLSSNARLLFVNPPETPMGGRRPPRVGEAGVPFAEEPDLDAALPQADVVYQTRVQKERSPPRPTTSRRRAHTSSAGRLTVT
jgi:aspartate carbamoyltransferase catalytic subunit